MSCKGAIEDCIHQAAKLDGGLSLEDLQSSKCPLQCNDLRNDATLLFQLRQRNWQAFEPRCIDIRLTRHLPFLSKHVTPAKWGIDIRCYETRISASLIDAKAN